MRGVVDYRGDANAACGATTLYLGEEEVLGLKGSLEDTTLSNDGIMRVLRRLAAMPITRSLLESTMVGATVGRLRKHGDDAVSDLAARIVKVWKAQLQEQRHQVAVKSKGKAR